MARTEILEAVARGWCHPDNEQKVMDEKLAVAIAAEVCAVDRPLLGLATTKELIDELAARADVSATCGEAWPNYRGDA